MIPQIIGAVVIAIGSQIVYDKFLKNTSILSREGKKESGSSVESTDERLREILLTAVNQDGVLAENECIHFSTNDVDIYIVAK